jgi:hypothetical protein
MQYPLIKRIDEIRLLAGQMERSLKALAAEIRDILESQPNPWLSVPEEFRDFTGDALLAREHFDYLLANSPMSYRYLPEVEEWRVLFEDIWMAWVAWCEHWLGAQLGKCYPNKCRKHGKRAYRNLHLKAEWRVNPV